jgi:hypothetical protein
MHKSPPNHGGLAYICGTLSIPSPSLKAYVHVYISCYSVNCAGAAVLPH